MTTHVKNQPLNKRFKYQDSLQYGESTGDDGFVFPIYRRGAATKDVLPKSYQKKPHARKSKPILLETEAVSAPKPKPVIHLEPVAYWKMKQNHGASKSDAVTVCPVCKMEFTKAGAWSQHAKAHVRRGELEKREVVRPERGNITRGYLWSSPFEYVKVKG